MVGRQRILVSTENGSVKSILTTQSPASVREALTYINDLTDETSTHFVQNLGKAITCLHE